MKSLPVNKLRLNRKRFKKGCVKALFLDRDGVINKRPEAHDYVKHQREFVLNSSVIPIIKTANENGYLVVVVTNQRGIARGLITTTNFIDICQYMDYELAKYEASINWVYYCPHDIDENCYCRKPKPGMIIEAMNDCNIDAGSSILFGDSESDREAARAAKIGKTFIASLDDPNASPISIGEIFG